MPKHLFVSVFLACLLIGLTTSSVHATQEVISFVGTGSGTSEILSPEKCSTTGECHVEIKGTFDASDAGLGTGSVRFEFEDDWSRILSGSNPCSIPSIGKNTFIWETNDGEGIFMTQTSGFICPSQTGSTGSWKRFLRVDGGTGRFTGAKGTVFLSGRTNLMTGESNWTFQGMINTQRQRESGCFRAYFVSGLVLIPPRGAPPPGRADFDLWLCGDDISISGPIPREGYQIFNAR